MKKLILITIFILFSSVSFAEVSTDWKWGKVFNSVVLVSGENIAEIIIEDPNENNTDEGPHEQEPKFDTLKPRLIPYGMGTGFLLINFI